MKDSKLTEQATSFFEKIFVYGFDHYKDFILGLLIGMIIAFGYHKIIGGKELRNSYDRIIKSKDETIVAFKYIINERLSAITVDPADKRWFNRLKKFFS